MKPNKSRDDRFVSYLEDMAKTENRSGLAALRRGLGKEPGTAAEMYPYVARWLPVDAHPWDEQALYLAASLFAAHPLSWDGETADNRPTNLGASFRRMADQAIGPNGDKEKAKSIERRFTAVLSSHRDDLPSHLGHTVNLLKAKTVPVDWTVLIRDIRDWDRDDRRVQRAWARAYWGQRADEDSDSSDSEAPTPEA